MHIGISLMYWPWFEPVEQLELAVQADLAGLHSVWVAEGYGQEAAAMLGLLAGCTRRILLGDAAGVDLLVVAPFGDRAALVAALAQHNCATAQPGEESRRFRCETS